MSGEGATGRMGARRLLSLEDVSKNYTGPGETVHAVADVSLSIEPGDFVTLLGPSGSGKTTLLFLAAGILHPDAGSIHFKREDISAMSEKEAAHYRRCHLGFIFQNYNLMPGTAAENVALPLRLEGERPRVALKRAGTLLDQVGLEKRADHIADQLSGGERQRVAIARALANSPSLVLADEPTGNLDSERGEQVLSLLRGLSRELHVGVLLVSHDARATEHADRSYRMQDGRLSQLAQENGKPRKG